MCSRPVHGSIRARRSGICTSTSVSARSRARLIRHYAERCSLVVANSESVAADVRTVTGTRTPVRVIYNAVDLHRFSPAGRWGWKPGCLSGPALRHPRAPSVWDSSPPSAGGRATTRSCAQWRRCLLPCASGPTSSVARSTTPTAASIPQSSCAGSPRRTAWPIASASPASSTAQTWRCERWMSSCTRAPSPEPFGLVIAEAMACGRALVTSAAGGAAELVRPGVDALTHRPGSAGDLAAAIAGLAADAGLRERLGQAARTARRRFDARRLAGDFATATRGCRPLAGRPGMNGVITAGVQPAARGGGGGSSRTPWGFAELFVISQTALPALLYPAGQPGLPPADPLRRLRHQPRGVRVVADSVGDSMTAAHRAYSVGRGGDGPAGGDAVPPDDARRSSAGSRRSASTSR